MDLVESAEYHLERCVQVMIDWNKAVDDFLQLPEDERKEILRKIGVPTNTCK